MPEFTITHLIHAQVQIIGEILNDYGDIQRWSPGAKMSNLSAGPIGVSATRHCNFAFGGATERIDAYEPGKRITNKLIETYKMLMFSARVEIIRTPRDQRHLH